MECTQGWEQDYKRWRFGSGFRRRILVLSRYLFSVGVPLGSFGIHSSSLFSVFEIPCVQHLGLFSKRHIISTNMVSNDPACDALQTNSKDNELALAHSKLSRLDWKCKRPSALVEPSLPSRMVRRTDLTYDSNSFARAYPITPDSNGETFLVEVHVE